MKHDDFIIPFGLNKGKTFREVSLRDLDRLIIEIEKQNLQTQFKDLYQAANVYLNMKTDQFYRLGFD